MHPCAASISELAPIIRSFTMHPLYDTHLNLLILKFSPKYFAALAAIYKCYKDEGYRNSLSANLKETAEDEVSTFCQYLGWAIDFKRSKAICWVNDVISFVGVQDTFNAHCKQRLPSELVVLRDKAIAMGQFEFVAAIMDFAESQGPHNVYHCVAQGFPVDDLVTAFCKGQEKSVERFIKKVPEWLINGLIDGTKYFSIVRHNCKLYDLLFMLRAEINDRRKEKHEISQSCLIL